MDYEMISLMTKISSKDGSLSLIFKNVPSEKGQDTK